MLAEVRAGGGAASHPRPASSAPSFPRRHPTAVLPAVCPREFTFSSHRDCRGATPRLYRGRQACKRRCGSCVHERGAHRVFERRCALDGSYDHHHRRHGRGDGPDLRFHERVSRHGKRDGDLDCHRSAKAQDRRNRRRNPKPRRRVSLHRGGQDHLGRHHQRTAGHDRRGIHLCGPCRRDLVEPHHLACGLAVQFVACAVRRSGGRGHRGRGRARGELRRRRGQGPHPGARLAAGCRSGLVVRGEAHLPHRRAHG